MEMLQEGIEA